MEDKAQLAAVGLSEFLKQFGDANDPHTIVVLTILFEELFKHNNEDLPISRAEGQKQH